MLKENEKKPSASAVIKASRTKPGLVSEAMSKNRRGNARVNVPREYARAEWSVENPPSLVNLKLLTLIIAACGNDLSGFKEFPLSLLREVPGLNGASKVVLKGELKKLMSVQISAPDEKSGNQLIERFGVVLSDARLISENENVVKFGVIFGETFKGMISSGEFYTVIDASIILGLRNRHSILFYQFLASVSGQIGDHITLPLSDVRRIFALPDDKFSEFKRFKRDVLVPVCKEISELTNWVVVPTAVRSLENGRSVDRIRFDVSTKELALPEVKPKRGRPAINKPQASEVAILQFWADAVKDGGKRQLGTDISPQRARDMLAAGLVQPDELRARGVQF